MSPERTLYEHHRREALVAARLATSDRERIILLHIMRTWERLVLELVNQGAQTLH